MTKLPKPRLLFLTPFNFATPERDNQFDGIVQRQLASIAGFSLTAHHVARFNSEDKNYEEAQRTAIISAVRQARIDGYDAVVIACHYDPALAAARSAVPIPIVGPLQFTTALAVQFGPKFAVITDVVEAESVIQGLVEDYGLGHACAEVLSIGLDGDAILEDTKAAAIAVNLLVRDIAGRAAVQSVVIGCTIVSAAYEQHRLEFPDHGVTIINSNLLALKGAALLCDMARA